MTSLVGYARVSTESQTERQTIEQQVESLTRYAHEHGWDLDRGDIYRDEGFSGARLDRPGLDRLRDAVSSGEVDTILVASPDRLARRYAYQVWLLEEFERAGCRVVFLEHPVSNDPQDALLIQIRGAVAEYERTVIADRMRRGRLSALQAGRMLPFSIPPFGYRADPLRPRDPEALRVDEGEAMVVRRIFEGYVGEGLSLYGMAKALTEEGVPTSAGKAIWSSSTIHKILTNPTYSGTCYGNREQAVAAKRRYPLLGREARGEGGVTNRLRPRQEWIAVEVPAIVSAELFRQAQERMSQKQDRALRNTRGEYLLRRLVSCSSCGLACIVRNNGRKASYVCGGKGPLIMRRRPERCNSPQIPTEQLDELVWEDLRRVLNEPAVLEEALRQARQGWQDGTERGARRKQLHRAELELRRRIERLMDRVILDPPGVEIRYVIPISGAAQRNGVLRPRHFRGGDERMGVTGQEAGVTRRSGGDGAERMGGMDNAGKDLPRGGRQRWRPP